MAPDRKRGSTLPFPPSNAGAEIGSECGPPGDKRSPGESATRDAILPTPHQSIVVTPTLIGISVAVYIAMVLRHVSPTHPSSEQLLAWGANFGPLVLGGQWWRLFTSVFLHIGLTHLALNMWCLWNLGVLAERLWGRGSLLAVYLASGLAGAIAGVAWHPFVASAGASGAIFGVAGALILFLQFSELPISRKASKATLASLLLFAGYNLAFGWLEPSMDNAAHVGGFVAGLLLGFLLAQRRRKLPVFTMAAVVLVFAWVLTGHNLGYVVHAERGRAALAAGKTDTAIAELTTTVQKNPKFGEGYRLLGQAYLLKSQLVDAETCLRRAIALDPYDARGRYELGLLMAKQGRTREALDIFRELARLQPGNPSALTGLGEVAMMAGDYEQALIAFRRASELAPNDPQLYLKTAIAANGLKRYDVAIEALSKSLQLQPRNYAAEIMLAQLYQAKGMDREAQAAYARAAKLNSGN